MNCFPSRSLAIAFPQNQLLALDKENNIQTTIHTNLLVESFYTTSHASNNNLLSEMNEYTTSNNVQSLTSPTRDNLIIDGSDCTEECNRSSCNCSEGGNDNENYGKPSSRFWYGKALHEFLRPFIDITTSFDLVR